MLPMERQKKVDWEKSKPPRILDAPPVAAGAQREKHSNWNRSNDSDPGIVAPKQRHALLPSLRAPCVLEERIPVVHFLDN